MNKETLLRQWRRFLRWPGWTAWLKWKGWSAIARWPGWTAWLHWKGWKSIAGWSGWKRLFVLHPVLAILLTVVSVWGLCWVFLSGQENSWTAGPVYALSAYTLIVAAAGIPRWIRGIHGFIRSNPYASRYVNDEALRFTLSLYFEQIINACYGVFKTLSGIFYGSAWIGADGLYNLAQATIQLIQILRRKKNLTLMQQWKSYRLCGWLVLIMHLTITGLVFQMTRMGRSEEYPGYMILVTAMFAFYKLITAFIDVAKDRKNKAPIDSSVMLLDLAQALFSLFSLQVAMIHQFEGSEEFAALMNTLTGSAVCLLVVAMGIYMLRRSRREMRKLEERDDV